MAGFCIFYISIFLDSIIRDLGINSQLQVSFSEEVARDFGIRGGDEVAGIEAASVPALVCAVAMLAEVVID